jgi:hypothetical protein
MKSYDETLHIVTVEAPFSPFIVTQGFPHAAANPSGLEIIIHYWGVDDCFLVSMG